MRDLTRRRGMTWFALRPCRNPATESERRVFCQCNTALRDEALGQHQVKPLIDDTEEPEPGVRDVAVVHPPGDGRKVRHVH